jgi:hypothetical protein
VEDDGADENEVWKKIESDFRAYRNSLDSIQTVPAYTHWLQRNIHDYPLRQTKGAKYTEEDMRKAFDAAREKELIAGKNVLSHPANFVQKYVDANHYLQSLHPKKKISSITLEWPIIDDTVKPLEVVYDK